MSCVPFAVSIKFEFSKCQLKSSVRIFILAFVCNSNGEFNTRSWVLHLFRETRTKTRVFHLFREIRTKARDSVLDIFRFLFQFLFEFLVILCHQPLTLLFYCYQFLGQQ
jgi:hypothetical protein